MLCYRCGSHVQDGAEKCWNCDTRLAAGGSKAGGATLEELREKQRTKSRISGAVYKVGDVLANRYKVKDIAGSGGAGVVYRAHDQDIDVDVALKVMNAKLLQTPEEKKLFSREIKTAKKLSHQNIVRIYDEGKDGDRAFFTMQFLEGLSLRKIIDLRKEKKQHFALSEVEPIYNQLCQALDYAHKSTLHGDLKPDNILVLPDLLKVTDFGLLRGLPRKPFLAIQKSRQPNFAYLAPEVRLEVEELSPGADIYSLGVILAEMLTGQVIDENKPEQLSVAKTGLDSAILKVIRRATLRAPKERYAGAIELYEDLRSILAKGDVVAKMVDGNSVPAPPAVDSPKAVSDPPKPEPETELPTQRLDISKHGARPVSEEGVSVKVNAAPVDGAVEGGTGTFAAIDDEMIESQGSNESADLPVPPLAEEGDEPTEALEELSASEIELVADPRATNVIEVDHTNDKASIKRPTNGPPASVALEKAGPSEKVIISMPALPNEPAFTQHAENTQAGRLDLPTAAAPAVSNPAPAPVKKKPTAPPTSPVIRGMPSEPAPRSQEVSVQGVSENAEPRVIPRSPTTAMNGTSSPAAPTTNGASKTPRSRPMTRPRMAAMKNEPGAIFEGFPKTDTPLDPTGARPLVVTPQGIDRKPTGAKTDAGPRAKEDKRIRPLIYVGGALLLGLIALIIVLVVFVMRTNEALHEQERQMAEIRNQASQARETANAAGDERQKIEDEQKQNDEKLLAANKAAEDAAIAKKKAEEEAALLAKQSKAGEADLKRKEAEEAEKKRLAELARAEAELKKKSDLEGQRVAAADREERAKAAAEERERKLREKEAIASERDENKKRAAEEAAQKRADAEAAAALKRAEAEEKKKADAEAKKLAAEEEAKKKAESGATAAAAAAIAPAPGGKSCPTKGMAIIDGGSFMMGAPRNDPERNFGDKTYASVEVGAFCIDYYEAPNGPTREPTTKVSWAAADKACKAKQKRLCTEDEWEKACKGPSGLRYPYGNQWDPAVCATEDDEGNDRQIAKSATFQKCRSGYNVFDLSGNVAEWTATPWEGGDGYVVKGGSADRPGYDGRCAARKKKPGNSPAETLGYRCCADPK